MKEKLSCDHHLATSLFKTQREKELDGKQNMDMKANKRLTNQEISETNRHLTNERNKDMRIITAHD